MSCRRATSEIASPPEYDSATIRALASLVQRRRRPTPVITSIRRTSPAVRSNVWLLIWSNRSRKRNQHHRAFCTPSLCGGEITLTLHLAQERFESCEELFDGIEIRAVGRQENGTCAASL